MSGSRTDCFQQGLKCGSYIGSGVAAAEWKSNRSVSNRSGEALHTKPHRGMVSLQCKNDALAHDGLSVLL